jgi:hypothetical protein
MQYHFFTQQSIWMIEKEHWPIIYILDVGENGLQMKYLDFN